MTLSDLRSQIFTHFLNNSTLFLADITKFKVDANLEKCKADLITTAMKDFEEQGMVKRILSKEEILTGWILENKIGNAFQEVAISYNLCHAISDTINAYITAHKLSIEKSDPLNLGERDIGALLGIISEIVNKDSPDAFEEEDGKEG